MYAHTACTQHTQPPMGKEKKGKEKKSAPESSGGGTHKLENGNWVLGGNGKVGIPPHLLRCACGRLAHGLPRRYDTLSAFVFCCVSMFQQNPNSVVRKLLDSGEFEGHTEGEDCANSPMPAPLELSPQRSSASSTALRSAASPNPSPNPAQTRKDRRASMPVGRGAVAFQPTFNRSTDSLAEDTYGYRTRTSSLMSPASPGSPLSPSQSQGLNASFERRGVRQFTFIPLSEPARDVVISGTSSPSSDYYSPHSRSTVVRSGVHRRASPYGSPELLDDTRRDMRRDDFKQYKPPPSTIQPQAQQSLTGMARRDFIRNVHPSLHYDAHTFTAKMLNITDSSGVV